MARRTATNEGGRNWGDRTPKKRKKFCRYNFRGHCRDGDDCRFSHDPTSVPQCLYFKNSECRFGKKCWYRHDRPNAPDRRPRFNVEKYKKRQKDLQEKKMHERHKEAERKKLELLKEYSINPYDEKPLDETYVELDFDEALSKMKNLRSVYFPLHSKINEAEWSDVRISKEMSRKSPDSSSSVSKDKKSDQANEHSSVGKDEKKEVKHNLAITKEDGRRVVQVKTSPLKDRDLQPDVSNESSKVKNSRSEHPDENVKSSEQSNADHQSENLHRKVTKEANVTEISQEEGGRIDNSECNKDERPSLEEIDESPSVEKSGDQSVNKIKGTEIIPKVILNYAGEESCYVAHDEVLIVDDYGVRHPINEKVTVCTDENNNVTEAIPNSQSTSEVCIKEVLQPSAQEDEAHIVSNVLKTVDTQNQDKADLKEGDEGSNVRTLSNAEQETMRKNILAYRFSLEDLFEKRSIHSWSVDQVTTFFTNARHGCLIWPELMTTLYFAMRPSAESWATVFEDFLLGEMKSDEYDFGDLTDSETGLSYNDKTVAEILATWEREGDANELDTGGLLAGLHRIKPCKWQLHDLAKISQYKCVIFRKPELELNTSRALSILGFAKCSEFEKLCTFTNVFLCECGKDEFNTKKSGSKCKCKTFDCCCPVEYKLDWEMGGEIISMLCEHMSWDLETKQKFFQKASQRLWNSSLMSDVYTNYIDPFSESPLEGCDPLPPTTLKKDDHVFSKTVENQVDESKRSKQRRKSSETDYTKGKTKIDSEKAADLKKKDRENARKKAPVRNRRGSRNSIDEGNRKYRKNSFSKSHTKTGDASKIPSGSNNKKNTANNNAVENAAPSKGDVDCSCKAGEDQKRNASSSSTEFSEETLSDSGDDYYTNEKELDTSKTHGADCDCGFCRDDMCSRCGGCSIKENKDGKVSPQHSKDSCTCKTEERTISPKKEDNLTISKKDVQSEQLSTTLQSVRPKEPIIMKSPAVKNPHDERQKSNLHVSFAEDAEKEKMGKKSNIYDEHGYYSDMLTRRKQNNALTLTAGFDNINPSELFGMVGKKTAHPISPSFENLFKVNLRKDTYDLEEGEILSPPNLDKDECDEFSIKRSRALESNKCQGTYMYGNKACVNCPKKDCIQGMCRKCCEKSGVNCETHEEPRNVMEALERLVNPCCRGDSCDDSMEYYTVVPSKHFNKLSEFLQFMDRGYPVLRRISFGSNFGIRNEHIMVVAQVFNKNLQVIELGSADTGEGSGVTDTAITHLAKLCPHLIKVKLESCVLLTDESVRTILEHCPDLKHLQVSGNDKVLGHLSKNVLKPLFDKHIAEKLRFICLNDQPSEIMDVVTRLRRARPELKVIATSTAANYFETMLMFNAIRAETRDFD